MAKAIAEHKQIVREVSIQIAQTLADQITASGGLSVLHWSDLGERQKIVAKWMESVEKILEPIWPLV